MKQRRLGTNGPMVSAIGLGCMTMTSIYGQVDEAECVATIHEALDAGLNFLDSSDAYGGGSNEELIGRAIKGRRDKALVATKFGNVRLPDGKPGGDGRPEYVVECCDKSLKRLGIEVIDIYFQHRVDRRVPIEDTVGAMAGLVKAGKVRFLGLSEAAPATIRRAAAVHPISALQTEYSLWCRFAEDELLPTCRALGIAYVAYAPLGRGFLTAGFKSLDSLPEKDRRREHPRFYAENFAKNVALLAPIEAIAKSKGCTPAQIALAWLLGEGDDIVPIPGMSKRTHLADNIAATEIALTKSERDSLRRAIPPMAAGERYPVAQLDSVNV
jgi:aryl-alcohol dehydrogenase-like predicted oxidoreductase